LVTGEIRQRAQPAFDVDLACGSGIIRILFPLTVTLTCCSGLDGPDRAARPGIGHRRIVTGQARQPSAMSDFAPPVLEGRSLSFKYSGRAEGLPATVDLAAYKSNAKDFVPGDLAFHFLSYHDQMSGTPETRRRGRVIPATAINDIEPSTLMEDRKIGDLLQGTSPQGRGNFTPSGVACPSLFRKMQSKGA